MIELTQDQRQELSNPEPMARDPLTNETYVLVKSDVYERIKNLLYDANPWTDEEMDLLHEEAARMADQFGKKP